MSQLHDVDQQLLQYYK